MTEWRTSSLTNNGTCVEVTDLPGGGTDVRDSKDPAGPVLSFTAADSVAVVRGVTAGEFG